MTTSIRRRIAGAALLVAVLPLTACDNIFDLEADSPGLVADDDLNSREALDGLVVGMSFNLTDAYDVTLQDVTMAGGNLWHGGSYDFGSLPRGILSEAEDWDAEFNDMQQSRWVAESGLRRMAEVLDPAVFERDRRVARAYVLAGFSNRLLGELQCVSTIDGGPEVPHTEHFQRADSQFSRAITVGQAAGADDVVTAAYGGRASIRAWLGRWGEAVQDAQQVPRDFSYDAIFDLATNNDLVFETTSRKEFTVWSTLWEDVPDDPRVPWQIVFDDAGQVERGQDGSTPFYQQLKFTDLTQDVPMTKGTEMLVLRAEAALRDGDLGEMTSLLNQARDAFGMDDLDEPADAAAAWELLRFERSATLWLEGRRLWDLRRWEEEGGIVADPFSQGRDVCFPIGDEERRANPNL